MDQELKKLLSIWSVEAPPADILDRVVRHAMTHPQPRSWRVHLALLGEQIFGTWSSYGLAYRCALLVVCMGVGFSSGMSSQPAPHRQQTANLFDNSRELAMADDILGIYN